MMELGFQNQRKKERKKERESLDCRLRLSHRFFFDFFRWFGLRVSGSHGDIVCGHVLQCEVIRAYVLQGEGQMGAHDDRD